MIEFKLIDSKKVIKALLYLKESNPDIIKIVNRFMDDVNREGLHLLAENAVNLEDELVIETNLAKMSGVDFAVNAIMNAIIEEGEKK